MRGRLGESSKAGRDLSSFRSDREVGVVDLVTVWVGSRGRQAGTAGSRREGSRVMKRK